MLALAVMGSGMLSSCTDNFEDLNTNKTQVDPTFCHSQHSAPSR